MEGPSAMLLKADMPKRTVREVLPGGVRFTYRWFGARYVFQTLFLLAWGGVAFASYSEETRGMDWSAGLDHMLAHDPFGVLFFGAVGIALAYSMLSGFINRTVVDVATGNITIKHGPLPWRGNRTLPAHTVSQLYREEKISRSRSGTRTSYQLSAALKDGGNVRLLADLPSADLALYLEQEIEQRLGLRDQPVAGEMRK